jgi:hypothetical protein
MKRILSLLLIPMLLIGLFAACATDTDKADHTNDTTAAKTTEEPKTEATTQAETTSAEPATTESPDTGNQDPKEHMLNGKKILFIGNSYTYYGKTVLEKNQTVLTQEARSNDQGFFYQLCKANGANVSVTNWTFGGHDFVDLFENCTANRGCDGVDHKSYLTDRSFDYVIMQQGSGSANDSQFMARIESVMQIFKDANPNVKFVFLVQTDVHNKNYSWKPLIKQFDEKNVTVVDWGSLVCDIINGVVAVPGAAQTYNKNSFIVCRNASDGYHPNMLTGYITTLMTYCAIPGENAVGQTYAFCNDSTLNTAFDFNKFIGTYYTYNNAKTNFPAVFSSESDMKGIQQLIDQYLAQKAYLNY